MSIKRNSLYNLIGFGMPLLAALITIPYLINHLGEEKFGILTLIWAILSYAGLLDLGLSKAVTHRICVLISEGRRSQISSFFKSSRLLLLTFSAIIAIILVFTLELYISILISGFNGYDEAAKSLYIVALALPFVTLASLYRGVLEAKEEFLVINTIRLPMGLATFIVPALVVYFRGDDLLAIVMALALTKVIAFAVYHQTANWKVIEINGHAKFDWIELRQALNMGGWLTLTNIISPLMGYVDRFILASVTGPQSLAYYVTAQEIVTRLWIIPGAITASIFPRFSNNGMHSPKNVPVIIQSLILLLFTLSPICIVIFVFSDDLITLWISQEFSEKSAPLLRIMTVGIFINCFSHIPFTYLQGIGKARLTAIIQIIQFPFFIAALMIWIAEYGALGAAYAFLFRICIDSVLMLSVSLRYLSFNGSNYGRGVIKL